MCPPMEIPSGIKRDLDQLNQHPRILDICEALWVDEEQTFRVTINFSVELPSRRRACGMSRTGVCAVEPVTFVFPQSYPLHAPEIYLRADFPRTFAHIQPGNPQDPPVPCIFYGDINELFHFQGLWGITNQLADWLQKAALDDLIDPAQGWEPIRRDNLEDIVVGDLDSLRALCKRQEQYYFFSFKYIKWPRKIDHRQDDKRFLLSGQINEQQIAIFIIWSD